MADANEKILTTECLDPLTDVYDDRYAASSHGHAASAITSGALAVANGGTGAADAQAARENLGAAAASHTHAAGDITSGALGVARGGTGQTTAASARAYLGDVPQATSSSSATASAKTATLSGFALFAGARVKIKSTYANTYESGALTLNVNSTGAKTVYVNGAATSASNTLLWSAGTILEFYYDGSYWHFLGAATERKATQLDLDEAEQAIADNAAEIAALGESVSRASFVYTTNVEFGVSPTSDSMWIRMTLADGTRRQLYLTPSSINYRFYDTSNNVTTKWTK